MSQENLETVRRLWEIWSEGTKTQDPRFIGIPFEEGILTPDSSMTTQVPGASETFVGEEGVQSFVRTWAREWANWQIELEDVIDADDDRVIAKLRQSGVARQSGIALSRHFISVNEFRDGRIVARRDYPDLDQALEAEGLGELPG